MMERRGYFIVCSILLNLGCQVNPQKPSAGKCVLLSDCPYLTEVLNEGGRRALEEFDMCGNGRYICPEAPQRDDACNCIFPGDCPALLKIVQEKRFSELKNHQQCGFDGLKELYCCPRPIFQRNLDLTNQALRDDQIEYFEGFQNECGSSFVLNIFGGDDADDHEFPWLVALKFGRSGSEDKAFGCGGALITDRHVLTAAHCLSRPSEGIMLETIRLGHARLSSNWSFEVPVEKESAHPDYKRFPFPVNDIAILKLSTPVELEGVRVRNLCLPEEDNEPEGEAEIAGWGSTSFDAPTSDQLQKLFVNVTTTDACLEKFRSIVPNFQLVDTKLCASGKLGTDGCKGDSGGPLMKLRPSGKFEAIGVTSFGIRTCDSSVPAVYTNVAKYINWIQNTIWNERS